MSNFMEEAFAPIEAENRNRVMTETWGHLAPKVGRVYTGWLVFAIGCCGDETIVDWKFEDLPGSPWFQQGLENFISDRALPPGDYRGFVFRFEGTVQCLNEECNEYKFSGKTRRLSMKWKTPSRRMRNRPKL